MPPPLLDLLSRAAMYSPKVESSLCSRAASSPALGAPSLAPADPRVSLPAGRVFKCSLNCLGMHQVSCYSVAVSCKASGRVGFARGEKCVTSAESEWESQDGKDPLWCQQQCVKGGVV